MYTSFPVPGIEVLQRLPPGVTGHLRIAIPSTRKMATPIGTKDSNFRSGAALAAETICKRSQIGFRVGHGRLSLLPYVLL